MRRAAIAVVAIVVLVVFVWALRGRDLDRASGQGVAPVEPRPEGTGGSSGPPAVVPPETVQRFANLARGEDVEQLVGQRVELQVTAHDMSNDVAFWVPSGQGRMLVVTARDNRSEVEHQRGEPASHAIEPIQAGQRVTISGTVQRLPWAEAMFSWGLTNGDVAELRRRNVYIRADRISVDGERERSRPTQ